MKKYIKKHTTRLKEATKKPINKLRRRSNVTDVAKVPFITNESIAEHREEVLRGARKYIYPLQHSRHRIVIISSSIFIALIIAFFTYSLLALYKFQSTSTFIYRVTQIIPFPVAKVPKAGYVSYESYLFELRHYIHYYETQQKSNLQSGEGKQQLEESRKQSLQRVVDDAYVKQLAKQHNVTVTNKEVDTEIELLRQQNRLGSSNDVFEDVLKDFWGWSLADFKRSLRQQLLARKVAASLDADARARANAALQELTGQAVFADVAKKYTDDAATKEAGGEYPIAIDKSNRDIAPQVTKVIFDQEAGQYSQIIDTGYALEIVRTLGFEGDKARAAHIQINFKDISTYTKPLKDKQKASLYIKV